LNVHWVNGVRQRELHTEEPQLLELSALYFTLHIEETNSHKSPGIDQIRAELIKAGGRTIVIEIHKRVSSVWNKEQLTEQWKQSIALPVCREGDRSDCSNYSGISLCELRTELCVTSCCEG